MKKFFKREILESSIDTMKTLTLVIKPTQEVLRAYISNKLIKLFEKYNLGSQKNFDNAEYDEYDTNLYFPEWFEDGRKKVAGELCFVSIACDRIENKPHILEMMNIIENNLAEHTIDFYVANLTPVHILKILGQYDGEKFGLNDFLMTAQINQREFARLTGFAESYVSEVKNCKQALSMEMYKKIVKVFPLSCYEFLI